MYVLGYINDMLSVSVTLSVKYIIIYNDVWGLNNVMDVNEIFIRENI